MSRPIAVPKIVTFGDNVVDCYDAQGLMFPGGNAVNHAVYARRFGAQVSYIGAVADDPAGRHIRAALVSEGIDTDGLRIEPGRTAFCVIGSRNGEREFLRADLGVSIIAPVAEDFDRIAAANAVHTGRSSHVDAHLAAFAERAHLSFDFAVLQDRDRIARIAPHCYLASFSGGERDAEQIAALQRDVLAAGAEWCLVTRGEMGATLAHTDKTWSVPAATATLVDTLGAGDTFIARVLVGLLRAEDPEAILTAAALASAATCGHLGGFGHPVPTEIDESHAVTLDKIYTDSGEIRA